MIYAFVRLAGAGLIVAAIVAQLIRTVGNALESTTPHGGHIPTVIANFLSFFTIQSNLIAAITLTIGAVWAWTRGRDAAVEPRWYATLLACATTYMLVTGVVYNTLLRGVELPQGTTVPWSNEVLHVVAPLVMLLDLLVAARRRALAWTSVWIIVAYPIAWVLYTLLRSHLITAPATGDGYWYPYPFLNPYSLPAGYVGVTGYVVVIAAVIVGVGLLVVWVGNRRDRSGRRPGGDERDLKDQHMRDATAQPG